MSKWLWSAAVFAVLALILVVYNGVMTKNTKSVPNNELPIFDRLQVLDSMGGNTLIFWMRANHQTFTIGGQTFFQIGPSAGGYGVIIYTPADASKLNKIIGQSRCDMAALAVALESLTDQSTKEELQTKLACLGPLVFTPVPFSSD